MANFKLGDVVEKALATVGVTEERVTKVLGRPCGCKRRKEMLNRLFSWGKRVNEGKTEDAQKYLDEILEEPKEGQGKLSPEQWKEIEETAKRMEEKEAAPGEARSPQAPETNGGRPD